MNICFFLYFYKSMFLYCRLSIPNYIFKNSIKTSNYSLSKKIRLHFKGKKIEYVIILILSDIYIELSNKNKMIYSFL